MHEYCAVLSTHCRMYCATLQYNNQTASDSAQSYSPSRGIFMLPSQPQPSLPKNSLRTHLTDFSAQGEYSSCHPPPTPRARPVLPRKNSVQIICFFWPIPHTRPAVMDRQLKTIYEGGSKSFRADIQKPRQMKNVARDI